MQVFAYPDKYDVCYNASWQSKRRDYLELKEFNKHSENFMFVKYKVDFNKKYTTVNADTQLLGIFLYAYARKLMYNHVIYECAPCIIETDSACIQKEKHIKRLMNTIINDTDGNPMPLMYNGKGLKKFGQLEIENDNIFHIIAHSKKTYYFEYLDKNGKIKTKRRFKGISRKWLNASKTIVESDIEVKSLRKDFPNYHDKINYKWKMLCENYYLENYYKNLSDMNKFGEYEKDKDKYSA